MPPPRRRVTRWARAVLAAVGVAFAGCGEGPVSLGSEDVAAMLPRQMTAELDGLTVHDVDCIYLSPEQTRCFARGTGPRGAFELPVFVGERRGRAVWEVAESDVAEARSGTRARPRRLGEPVTVSVESGARVRVRVSRLVDPLGTTDVEAPSRAGNRYVSVRLAFRNVGSETFTDTPQDQINLRLSDGELRAPVFVGAGRCRTLSLLEVRLEPGETITGCVAFEVPRSVFPARASLGVGPSHRVFEWDLSDEDRAGSEAD